MIKKYKLENEKIKFEFLNLGCTITSIFLKNQNIETVLSFSHNQDYLENDIYLGAAIVGPYAGRISNAQYEIDNTKTFLDKNFLSKHSIHGGVDGLHKVLFEVTIADTKAFLHAIVDSFIIDVIFTLNKDGVTQEVIATSSKPKVFNPTNHTYFNFNTRNILDYTLNINSNLMYFLDSEQIPFKKTVIKDSVFDILNGNGTLQEIKSLSHPQFETTKFIDHPFKLNTNKVELSSKQVILSITTNQKWVTVYTGNYLQNETKYINKIEPIEHQGICLELQNIVNGINITNEEASILRPGEKYYAYYKYQYKKTNET